MTTVLQDLLSIRRLAPKTVSVYETALKQFGQQLGHQPTLDDLSDATLLSFERWLAPNRSPYTVRERTGRLKSLWRHAARRGWIDHWPTMAPLPCPEIRPQAYTAEDVRRLLEVCDDFWRAWFVTAWYTGERTGALRKLEWSMVNFQGATLELPGLIRKGGKAATYSLVPPNAEALQRLPRTSQLVFHFDRSEATFYLRINKLLKLAGLPPGRRNQTQRIRRSHLSYWQASGGDAAARANHSSPDVTWKHYLDRSILPQDDVEKRIPRIG